ncbi:MAG: PqqD family protein [Phycisphaerae bacterium]|jgi:hypothetical protein
MTRRPKRNELQKNARPANFLQAVPYTNQAMEVTRRPDGSTLVSVPIPRPKYLVPPLSWILPFSHQRRVELDRLGSYVLDMCDGRRSIESMIERFAGDHKLSFREAQLSVSGFLRQLVQRGILVIVGMNKDAEET